MADLETVDDAIEETARQQVLPVAPLLTSASQQWDNIRLEVSHQPVWKTPAHCHVNHVIGIYKFEHSGQFQLNIADQQYTQDVQQDCMLITPAGLFHSEQWNQPTEILLLSFHPNYLNQIALKKLEFTQTLQQSYPSQILPLLAPVDPTIECIGQLLKQSLQTEKKSNPLYIHSLGTAFATHVFEHYAIQKNYDDQSWLGLSPYHLKKIIEHINSSLHKPISINELAQILNINQYYFCKLFKKSMGISPYQYILQKRVERAKKLLKISVLSIIEIAMECGFANQSHLTKHFHKFTGLTPKAYRNLEEYTYPEEYRN